MPTLQAEIRDYYSYNNDFSGISEFRAGTVYIFYTL